MGTWLVHLKSYEIRQDLFNLILSHFSQLSSWGRGWTCPTWPTVQCFQSNFCRPLALTHVKTIRRPYYGRHNVLWWLKKAAAGDEEHLSAWRWGVSLVFTYCHLSSRNVFKVLQGKNQLFASLKSVDDFPSSSVHDSQVKPVSGSRQASKLTLCWLSSQSFLDLLSLACLFFLLLCTYGFGLSRASRMCCQH